MQNPQIIIENIVSFEKQFYEINPQGNLIESLIAFCRSFISILPTHYSLAITDTKKIISCHIAENLKLLIHDGQIIEELPKIKQAIADNEVMTQSANTSGINFNQITIPLHHSDGKTIGTFTLFYQELTDDFSIKTNDLKKELVQAICTGMQTEVICRYLAEKINHLFSADLVLFTACDSSTENFISVSEFKFDSHGTILDNFDRVVLINGNLIYKKIMNDAQTYVSRPMDKPEIQYCPFKNDSKQSFIVSPIISKDQIIGTLNIGFKDKSDLIKRTVDLIEELAGFVSICFTRDLLTAKVDESIKRVTEAGIKLRSFEEKITLDEITSESMSGTRENLLQIVRNMYNFYENPIAAETAITLSSVVDQLQKMTDRMIRLQSESKYNDNSVLGPVNIKSIINETILAIEERIVNKNLFNKSINIISRINDSGIAEFVSNEFEQALTDLVFSLIQKTPAGRTIVFDSLLTDGHLTISIRNFENEIPLIEDSKPKAGYHRSSDPFFRLMQMLFHMNQIAFNFESLSDSEYIIEIIFKLISQSPAIKPDSEPRDLSRSGNDKFLILIVDDDDSLRELMVDILESRNFKVVCHGDPLSALEDFKKHKYDLLITDLGLPKISGLELAGKMKEINPKLPVIMVSGWGAEMEVIKEQNAQIDFVLAKPFNLIDLLRIVENSLKLLKP